MPWQSHAVDGQRSDRRRCALGHLVADNRDGRDAKPCPQWSADKAASVEHAGECAYGRQGFDIGDGREMHVGEVSRESRIGQSRPALRGLLQYADRLLRHAGPLSDLDSLEDAAMTSRLNA